MMFCSRNYSLKTIFFLVLFKFFLAIFFVAVCAFSQPLFADTITVGGSSGWQKLSVRNGVTETRGRFGHDAITLATNSHTMSNFTDMLIDFDNGSVMDKTGNYEVVSNALQSSNKSVMGNGAALSKMKGGIVLDGKNGSLFGTAGNVGSFTISFWLSPSTASSGEVIFNWRSSRTGYSAITGDFLSTDEINYQQINATFSGGVIEWSFFNIFDGAEPANKYLKYDSDIRVSGRRTIIPAKWSYHVITFNEENGLLEYRVNGEVEALRYVTTNGHSSGYAYPVYFGSPSEVEICPSYVGWIDDFKIERAYYDIDANVIADSAPEIMPSLYKVTGGRIETQPLMTIPGSTLNKVTAEMNIPVQTAVHLFVRSGDNYFGWTEDEPAWIPISNGETLAGIKGRYFQIAADLFPDGTGSAAPVVTEFTVDYTPPELPLPPFTIRAEAGNGSTTITWSDSVDDSTGGYYIYYGTRPGEYLGRTAVQGASPINIGARTSVTLTGLKNNTIYYFAVAAWSKYDERIVGQLSREVYARPAVK